MLLCVEHWIVWGEIFKVKGEFEAAKEKYRKALLLDEKNDYAMNELTKLEYFMEPQTESTVDEFVVNMYERKVELENPKEARNRDCICHIF